MKLIYTQLNDDAKDCGCFAFPYEAAGVFCDGIISFPIGLSCIGNILFEYEAGDKPNIVEADKAFIEHYNHSLRLYSFPVPQLKKIPNNVTVSIEK
jgi:hypothetical protein